MNDREKLTRRKFQGHTPNKETTMKFTRTFSGIFILLLLQACGSNDDIHQRITPSEPPAPAPQVTTIVDAAVSNGSFTTLVAALQATGLDATLSDTSQEFTVFAPTDAAFELLGQDTIDALLADTDRLSGILTYHVLSGRVDAATAIASAGNTVGTVNGANIGLSLSGDSLLVNTSSVTATDVVTDNGIIHVIDAVLLPPESGAEPTQNIVETAVADGRFTTLVAALQAANLVDALADETASYTVFAPTDDAFAMIDSGTLSALIADTEALSSVLLQHVLSGTVDSVTAFTLNGKSAETLSGAMIPISINTESDSLTFGGANIVIKDIPTTNGIIHVIDTVVVADVTLPSPPNTLVDVAQGNGSFNTLVAALQATGLDTVLADDSAQFTVFAPTDAAFALLGEEAIAALLADPETLRNILLYHVISGGTVLQDAALSVADSDNNKVEMANGKLASLSIANSALYVNTSKVSLTDVMADNGAIHVVDQVILPPAEKGTLSTNIAEFVAGNAEFSTLLTALETAGLTAALGDETTSFTVFAPTNAAFAKVEINTLNNLLADNGALTQVLTQHVVAGAEVSSIDAFATAGNNVATLSGAEVSLALVNFSDAGNSEMDLVAYDASNQRLIGGNGTSNSSSSAGLTLYTFDGDLGSNGSNCNDSCAATWPPVIGTEQGISNISGLSLITRDDGSSQVAYLGRPLYFFTGDSTVGEMNGSGVGDSWYTVSIPQVTLQVEGSNVTSYDVYTTNGVIHVIDTVITSITD